MVGTVEDALDMKRRPQADDMSEWERSKIGATLRIEIPLSDIYKLRKVAALLRGFADKIDNHTRRSDMTVKAILYQLKWDGSETAQAIKRLYPAVFRRRYIGSEE